MFWEARRQSKQDIKHVPRMSLKLRVLKNGGLVFTFRLQLLLTICVFMLSVSFEDPGAQGASGPWSSPEPHQIFPGPAQVSLSRHYPFFLFLCRFVLCVKWEREGRKKRFWLFPGLEVYGRFDFYLNVSVKDFCIIAEVLWFSLFLFQAIITVVIHLPILITLRVFYVGAELLIQLQHVMFWLVWDGDVWARVPPWLSVCSFFSPSQFLPGRAESCWESRSLHRKAGRIRSYGKYTGALFSGVSVYLLYISQRLHG